MIDDADLMKKAAAGDSQSFEMLVTRYSRELYNFFLRSTGSREDAEDLLQNLFAALFRNARRYRKSASFRTYLYRIASNMLISFYRKRKPSISIEDDTGEGGPVEVPDRSFEADPLKNLSASQLEEKFRDALSSLPVETAAALELRVRSGFSYREIAEIMDRSLSAVESMIFRGRKALADKIGYLRNVPGEGEN